MMPIAVNTFVWHSPLTDDLLSPTLRKIADWGFDAVELPLENVGDWDSGHAADLLQELGLSCVVGAVFPPGRELTAADDTVIDETLGYLRDVVDAAVIQRSPLVIGPMYTSVGRTWRMAPGERAGVVGTLRESLARIADYAGEQGVRLAVEPLNRYETSLLNTTEQVLDALGDLPIGLNLDTYHMNIEERSLDEAFDLAGDRLLHLQVCGNDRGAPGSDHLDWQGIRTGLERIGYDSVVGIESFTADNETIATAASIWRPLASSQDQLALDGLNFLQKWRDSP
jgi:D-psicose/D-tagatose/L-ribulose 3-epimerase